ncbi:hypothetical protein EDEG_02642 [Edhazardia aedis USNM 41457]|uniref:Uncharacterized protein n=1 Tax=Edhazardia aedis (strain USNM 41457) TaxID=1003232 RepID=J8ZTJ0_EDHAE|nr:hypothetical protein EDEG_02642 [Edhazardia aedis USNM 41457]|eukprot:EJW02998.2 hypothetical protein EDEG_02642 [Edhazardia aedis USNM 41457]
MGRNDLVQNDSKNLIPLDIDFLCKAMGFFGKGDQKMKRKLIKMYKKLKQNDVLFEKNKKVDSKISNISKQMNRIKKPIIKNSKYSKQVENQTYNDYILCFYLLSTTLLGLGDHRSRLQSKRKLLKYLKNDHTKFIPLCLALLNASEPVKDILKAIKNSTQNAQNPINPILALGIIGAGTKNKKIIRFLDKLHSVCIKTKIQNIIKISLSLCNLG